jgi:hypothetical protein
LKDKRLPAQNSIRIVIKEDRQGSGESSGLPIIHDSNLVDPASSHTLVSQIKPCMSQYKQLYGETAHGSLYQL